MVARLEQLEIGSKRDKSSESATIAAATVSLRSPDPTPSLEEKLGGFSTNPRQSPRTSRPPLASAQTAGRREADRDGAQRQPGRLRDDRRPLPGPPARLLPPDARLDRGRRGRAAGGLRQRLPGDARRRARDQPAPLALPDRPQPLPQPPAQTDRRRPGIDGHGARRSRPPRPPRRSTTARSSARSSADVNKLPETQRSALLLREMDALSYEEIAAAMDTTRALGQVAAGAGADLARRGQPGAPADLRRGPARARRGRRGPAQGLRPGPPPRPRVRGMRRLPLPGPLQREGAGGALPGRRR